MIMLGSSRHVEGEGDQAEKVDMFRVFGLYNNYRADFAVLQSQLSRTGVTPTLSLC